ncbi:MAG: LON peptidase substrate-binding domain-containing protein [Fimbriimonadaceae bacterium]|nr:LON peptidase substrate-binding domain-containing protein [Fimbriimonadaceae bacterium]
MSEHLEEMPLFPLNAVLFPHADLQVHVFEDRYREMVRDCVQYDSGFGVVLIRSGSEVGPGAEPYMVGTAVRIVKVQTFEDGKMDVHVRGQRRFRIRKLDESRSYLVGHVEPVVELEVSDEEWATKLIDQVRGTVHQLLEEQFSKLDVKVTSIHLPQDATDLSFVIANLLHCDNIRKQYLLETTDTVDRLSEMLPILEQQIVQAEEADRVESPTNFRLTTQHFDDVISPN